MLSLPPGTKMVHFPGFASRPLLYSETDVSTLLKTSLVDSEIPGSQPVCGSPRLIAAYHVLHRLPSPRHPPYALSSLTIKFTPSEILVRISRSQSYDFFLVFTRRYLIVKDQYFRIVPEIKGSLNELLISSAILVEVSGIEPLTPCLQSRCSSS